MAEAIEEMKEYVQGLEYLTTVGYTKEHVKTLKNYYKEQEYDVDGIKEDLDKLEDSLVLDEIKRKNPDWDDNRVEDFYNKVRQALGLDPKAYTAAQDAIPQSKIKPENISFQMTKEKLEQHRDDYRQYCPNLLPMDHIGQAEKSLIRAMATGRENGVPFLQNIADTYCRARINEYIRNSTNDLQPTAFCHKYKYFKTLKPGDSSAMQHALNSFHKRICPKMEFSSLLRIDDSLPVFFIYTAAMIRSIEQMVRKSQAGTLPPFQIDFWIIPKNVSSGMNQKNQNDENGADDVENGDDEEEDSSSSSEDDDDDDDNREYEYIDDGLDTERAIGDIEARLKDAALDYEKHEVEMDADSGNEAKHQIRIVNQQFNKLIVRFGAILKAKIKKEFEAETGQEWHQKDDSGLHKQRICIVADRRVSEDTQEDEKDNGPNDIDPGCRLFAYSPPSNCSRIVDVEPVIPESYFNASKECMLPGKGYGKDKGDKDSNEKPDTEQTQNIDVGTPMGGYQFTLSFHVAAVDDIKCYIFHNGQIARFFPQDMVDLWHIWFVNDYGPFRGDKDTWTEVNDIQAMLRDDDFVAWFGETTGNEYGPLLKKYRFPESDSDPNQKE